ncbi:MAG: dual specificity protein phosphatase family protein [Candidatus Gastranaerophilales bacterium]|nr:dual specificity protein phosphatase family protein [Candidatus Gastranaerophilales bacterium]
MNFNLISNNSLENIKFGNNKNQTLNIIRFKNIDNTLYRGAKPSEEEIEQLKELGISIIIDFTTGYGSNNQKSEKEIAKNLGINYINMPFPSFENPSDEYVNRFFNVMEQARKNDEKVYIHCREGKDRTGLFAAMYKLKYLNSDLQSCIQEMLDMGHDNVTNPNLIPYLKSFYYNAIQPNLNMQPVNYISRNAVLAPNYETEAFVNNFLNSKDSVEMTKILLQRYPELYWLTGDVNATPEWQINSDLNSISEKLFGSKHVEFDRTIVGIECLKHVLNGDYDKFTECQKESVKMTRENFDKLKDFTTGVIKTPQDADAILAFTMINDLGKIKEFVQNIESLMKRPVKDHDEALLMALKTIPDEIPSFSRLTKNNQNDIINSLDADFNLGQFVQGECLPANLAKIGTVGKRAMDLYLVHMFYDVAGAAGHVASNGSLVMNNNVFNGYMQGIESIQQKISQGLNETYDDFLNKKASDYNLSIDSPEEKSLVRLAILSRAYTPNDAQEVIEAFSKLNKEEQYDLLKGLSKDGINQKGVLLYYAPAFIQNAINAMPDNKIEMLAKAYKIMSRIYKNNKVFGDDEKVHIVSLANIANAIRKEPGLSAEELCLYL